jgi:hypothetical protein
MAKKKTKTKPKTIKTKSKLQPEKKAATQPETRKDISRNLKHLAAVAEELGVGCEIHHDDTLGGYVVNLSETSEDRSFEIAEEAEEFLHEHEQEEQENNSAQD